MLRRGGGSVSRWWEKLCVLLLL